MKRKTLTLILCLLTVMSLVGVGFASWVISADTQAVEQGNIVVDTVADQRLKLTATTSKEDIIFAGAPDGYEFPADAWLTLGEGSTHTTENLTVTYSCTLSYNDSSLRLTDTLTETGTVKTNVALTASFTAPSGSDAYNDAIVICFDEPDEAVISNVKINKANTQLTFDVSITYTWGTAFMNKNPFVFYNGLDINGEGNHVVDGVLGEGSTFGDEAVYFLGLLEDIDNTANFSITIDAKVNETDGIEATVITA